MGGQGFQTVGGVVLAVTALVGTVMAETEKMCGQFEHVTRGNYTFNNNAWNKDDSGFVCTYVNDDDSTTNSFTAEWIWQSEPPRVHAYPHVQFNSRRLPVTLANVTGVHLDLEWGMAPKALIEGASDDPNTQPDAAALEAIDIQANAVIDLFIDEDPKKSQTPSEQQYEIMVWLGRFGDASQPIGLSRPDQLLLTETIAGIEFILYNGTNGNGQIVLSWVPTTISTEFAGDIAPLIHRLPHYGLIPWTAYLGVLQFGCETFYAAEEVRFTVKRFAASIDTPNVAEGEGPMSTDVVDPPRTISKDGAGRIRSFLEEKGLLFAFAIFWLIASGL